MGPLRIPPSGWLKPGTPSSLGRNAGNPNWLDSVPDGANTDGNAWNNLGNFNYSPPGGWGTNTSNAGPPYQSGYNPITRGGGDPSMLNIGGPPADPYHGLGGDANPFGNSGGVGGSQPISYVRFATGSQDALTNGSNGLNASDTRDPNNPSLVLPPDNFAPPAPAGTRTTTPPGTYPPSGPSGGSPPGLPASVVIPPSVPAGKGVWNNTNNGGSTDPNVFTTPDYFRQLNANNFKAMAQYAGGTFDPKAFDSYWTDLSNAFATGDSDAVYSLNRQMGKFMGGMGFPSTPPTQSMADAVAQRVGPPPTGPNTPTVQRPDLMGTLYNGFQYSMPGQAPALQPVIPTSGQVPPAGGLPAVNGQPATPPATVQPPTQPPAPPPTQPRAPVIPPTTPPPAGEATNTDPMFQQFQAWMRAQQQQPQQQQQQNSLLQALQGLFNGGQNSGYNSWGNPQGGNPFSYMTGQTGSPFSSLFSPMGGYGYGSNGYGGGFGSLQNPMANQSSGQLAGVMQLLNSLGSLGGGQARPQPSTYTSPFSTPFSNLFGSYRY